jgi:hypothetical protein
VTPAEELRAAATKLRETAAKATRGPWIYYPTVSRRDLDGDEQPFTVSRGYCKKEMGSDPCEADCGADVAKAGGMGCEEDVLSGDNAAWISLVNPLLAEPLAMLLEDQAAMYEHYLLRGADVAERIVWRGLGAARVINGGAS